MDGERLYEERGLDCQVNVNDFSELTDVCTRVTLENTRVTLENMRVTLANSPCGHVVS